MENKVMWLNLIGIACVVAVVVVVPVLSAEQATRPEEPPSQLTITLPSEVSKRGEVPLTVSLAYDLDKSRTLTNYAFMFLLLDEDGNQVAINPFYREAIFVNVTLTGRKPIYKPRLVLNPSVKRLTVGEKYQLICVLPSFKLADATWFTLVE